MQMKSSAGKPTTRHQSMPTNLDHGCASPWPNYSLKTFALRERLARVRAEQYDGIYSLLDTRTPLSRLVT